MPAYRRNPTGAKIVMWLILLSAFGAPFGVMSYQLSVHESLLDTLSFAWSLTSWLS